MVNFSWKIYSVYVESKLKRNTETIEGISFGYDNLSFKESQIDRKFSFGNLQKEFNKDLKIQQEQLEKAQQQKERKSKMPIIGGVKLTSEQWEILKDGGHIYLKNMNQSDGRGEFSTYVFLNDEKDKAFFSKNNLDDLVRYGRYKMRIKDKILIGKGYTTKTKVKW